MSVNIFDAAIRSFRNASQELGQDKTSWVGCVHDGASNKRHFFGSDQFEEFKKAVKGQEFVSRGGRKTVQDAKLVIVLGNDRQNPIFEFSA